jgi:hypothetical protein
LEKIIGGTGQGLKQCVKEDKDYLSAFSCELPPFALSWHFILEEFNFENVDKF